MQAVRPLFIVVFAFCVSGLYGFFLPEHLELVRQQGDYYTVRERPTDLEQTYYISGGLVGEGWTLEVEEDSLVFVQVGQINNLLIEKLAIADFNQNRQIEIVGSATTPNCLLKLFENRGDFNYQPIFSINTFLVAYGNGDIDRDGLIDVLADWDISIYVYEQRQFGGYPDTNIWLVTPLLNNYRTWPRYCDLDKDNNLEIGFSYEMAVHIFECLGNNTFEAKDSIIWTSLDGGPGDFTNGDFDGDDRMEIVGGGGWGNLLIFENAADDSFELVWQGSLGNPNAYIHGYLGDTDCDGYGEWVSGSHNFSRGGFFFKVFEATGNNQYAPIYYDSLPGNPWDLGGVAVGDVDGDSINEFLFSANNNVGLYKYIPGTGWSRVWRLGNFIGTTLPSLLDLDNDGMAEIVLSNDYIFTKMYDIVQTEVVEDVGLIRPAPLMFASPNPANGSITVYIGSQRDQGAELKFYDISGRIVREFYVEAPMKRLQWDLRDSQGNEVPSGIYFVRLSGDGFYESQKITVLK